MGARLIESPVIDPGIFEAIGDAIQREVIPFRPGEKSQLVRLIVAPGLLLNLKIVDEDFTVCPDSPHRPVIGGKTENYVVVQDRKSTRLNSSHGYISYAV